MKKITVLIALSVVFLAIGCKNEPKNAENKEHSESEMPHSEHAHQEAAEMLNVQLDNGKKWVANAETTEGVQKMVSLIENFETNKSTDNKKLHADLNKEFTTIFEKCTMKGEAHNQLHNFLLPLKGLLDRLEEHADVADIAIIKAHLSSYNTYFQ